MRIMMTLQGDEPVAPIDAYLAALGDAGLVLATERLDPDEVATISSHGDTPPVIERAGSLLRAVWILDVASRDAAVRIARDIPGVGGVLEIRESYTPEDFGAPPDAPPPPTVPRTPGTQRYIAFIRSNKVAESGEQPTTASMAQMDAYCGRLVADRIMLGGEGLKPSSRGTRVRRSAAQRFVLDGPFTESKELVAGYMIVQARTLDEAVEHIRPWLKIHCEALGVADAAIEVRRLLI